MNLTRLARKRSKRSKRHAIALNREKTAQHRDWLAWCVWRARERVELSQRVNNILTRGDYLPNQTWFMGMAFEHLWGMDLHLGRIKPPHTAHHDVNWKNRPAAPQRAWETLLFLF